MWKQREWKEKQAVRESPGWSGGCKERGTNEGHKDPDGECEGDKENR